MDRLQVKIEIDRLNQEIEELKSENARYREALAFYANEQYYEDNYPHELATMYEDCCTIKNDYGDKAREALKGE